MDNSIEVKFLNELVKENELIFVYLVNGVRLDGYLLAFDATSLVLFAKEDAASPLLIYRNVVATVQQASSSSRGHFRKGTPNRRLLSHFSDSQY
jgi:RNA chaperone Hfq